jgi:hypothetical protein
MTFSWISPNGVHRPQIFRGQARILVENLPIRPAEFDQFQQELHAEPSPPHDRFSAEDRGSEWT